MSERAKRLFDAAIRIYLSGDAEDEAAWLAEVEQAFQQAAKYRMNALKAQTIRERAGKPTRERLDRCKAVLVERGEAVTAASVERVWVELRLGPVPSKVWLRKLLG
ncbi:hypothetical protein [Rivibacter subsaxonicus]|uniref:Uncharacterized protein n=1 Tax=Rivibacter subsaxonicus TaxID=457575 RepID=A0A4Q7VH04_9BURK|nr:hypothetical protein [Rivibacter subsaxonicus]RZT95304.1 hypothetical protein EV670_3057 [Rivibacter subsaxonicus]